MLVGVMSSQHTPSQSLTLPALLFPAPATFRVSLQKLQCLSASTDSLLVSLTSSPSPASPPVWHPRLTCPSPIHHPSSIHPSSTMVHPTPPSTPYTPLSYHRLCSLVTFPFSSALVSLSLDPSSPLDPLPWPLFGQCFPRPATARLGWAGRWAGALQTPDLVPSTSPFVMSAPCFPPIPGSKLPAGGYASRCLTSLRIRTRPACTLHPRCCIFYAATPHHDASSPMSSVIP